MRVGDFQFNLLFTQISPKKPKPRLKGPNFWDHLKFDLRLGSFSLISLF